jgi:Glycosyltransferases involved in cell wall biogenesis
MPIISVIIPVYNVEKYLDQCIKSVLDQTLKDIELICVDDGSTDGSLAILNSFAAQDRRMRVLTQKNLGAGAARNKGLETAHGKYLSFLDADDFFEPTMLELAYNRGEQTQADIVLFRENWYRDLDQRFEERAHVAAAKNLPAADVFSPGDIQMSPFLALMGWAWDKLFRRDYIQKTGLRFQEIRIYNDMSFTYSAVLLAERLTFIDRVLVHQRIQRGGAISTTIPRYWNCILQALSAVKKNLDQAGLYSLFESAYINYALHMLLFTLTRTDKSYPYMYDKLQREGFAQLGITSNEGAYENKEEYQRYLQIINTPIIDAWSAQINDLKTREAAASRVQALQKENSELKKQISLIEASATYRIGHAVTWLPRKLRGLILCYREHGLRYALQSYFTHRNTRLQ